jgi:hypothetical protein
MDDGAPVRRRWGCLLVIQNAEDPTQSLVLLKHDKPTQLALLISIRSNLHHNKRKVLNT